MAKIQTFSDYVFWTTKEVTTSWKITTTSWGTRLKQKATLVSSFREKMHVSHSILLGPSIFCFWEKHALPLQDQALHLKWSQKPWSSNTTRNCYRTMYINQFSLETFRQQCQNIPSKRNGPAWTTWHRPCPACSPAQLPLSQTLQSGNFVEKSAPLTRSLWAKPRSLSVFWEVLFITEKEMLTPQTREELGHHLTAIKGLWFLLYPGKSCWETAGPSPSFISLENTTLV